MLVLEENRDGSTSIELRVPWRKVTDTLYLSSSTNCFSEGNLSFKRELNYGIIRINEIPGKFYYRIMRNQYEFIDHRGMRRKRKNSIYIPLRRSMHSNQGRTFSYSSGNLSLLVFLHKKGHVPSVEFSEKVTPFGKIVVSGGADIEYTVFAVSGRGQYSLKAGTENEVYKISSNNHMNLGSGIIYHIFPDRFNVSADQEKKSHNIASDPRSPMGGNLKGILEKLDYLRSLNIKYLYLNPFFKSHSYHRYDVDDYFTVDPLLGSNKDLKTLIDTFHDEGIGVILDMVFNHTSVYFPPFDDILIHKDRSRFLKWYIFHAHKYEIFSRRYQLDSKGTKPPYETFMGVGMMPKLNHGNPEVVDFVKSVAVFYAKNFNVAGFRYDVGNNIPKSTIEILRKELDTINGNLLHIGEAWCLSGELVGEGYYNSLTNYHIRKCIINYVKGKIDLFQFYSRYLEEIIAYSNYIDNMMNILDSHDTVRILTTLRYNKNLLKISFALLMILNGHPTIYYGDEVGLGGNSDPDCRRPFPWERVGSSLNEFFRNITALRRDYVELRNGILMVSRVHGVDMFHKVNGDNTVSLLIGDGVSRDFILSSLKNFKILMENDSLTILHTGTSHLFESNLLFTQWERK